MTIATLPKGGMRKLFGYAVSHLLLKKLTPPSRLRDIAQMIVNGSPAESLNSAKAVSEPLARTR